MGGRVSNNLGERLRGVDRLWLIAFGAVFCSLALLAAFRLAQPFRAAWQTRSWITASCTIEKSAVEEQGEGDSYTVGVRFHYRAAGVEYARELSGASASRYSSYSEAYQHAARYSEGAPVECWVNPENHAEALLERKSLWLPALIVLSPLPFFFFGLIPLAIGIFGRAAGRDSRPLASRTGNPQEKTPAVFLVAVKLFFLIFVIVGLAASYTLLEPLKMMWRSRSWRAASCTVIKTAKGGSDDGSGYNGKILYRYNAGGREYRSDRYEAMSGAWDGRGNKWEIIEQYPPGRVFTCYYNPQDPSESLIKRGFSRAILFALIPLAVLLIGLAGVFFAGRKAGKAAGGGSRGAGTVSPQAPPESSVTCSRSSSSEEAQLVPLVSASSRLAWTAAAAVFLGIILGIIYFEEVFRGEISWPMLVNPFVWIEAVLLFAALPYFLMAALNPLVIVKLFPSAPALGEDVRLTWIVRGRAERFKRLEFTLVGVEEAEYRQGTDTTTERSVFYEKVLKDVSMLSEVRTGCVSFTIPDDLMHSWPLHEEDLVARRRRRLKEQAAMLRQHNGRRQNNRIRWELRVRGSISFWPDVREYFILQIQPITLRRF